MRTTDISYMEQNHFRTVTLPSRIEYITMNAEKIKNSRLESNISNDFTLIRFLKTVKIMILKKTGCEH